MSSYKHRFDGDEQFLTCKEVCKRYNISRTTLWRWEQKGLLPPAEFIGGKAKRHRLSKLIEGESNGTNQ